MGRCDSGLQLKNAFVGFFSHVRTAHRGPRCEELGSERNNGPLLRLHYTGRGVRGAQPGNGAKVSTVMQRLQETTVISAELRGRDSIQNLSL